MQHRKSYRKTTANDELNQKRSRLTQDTGEIVGIYSFSISPYANRDSNLESSKANQRIATSGSSI
jgi:hypothetical protein